MYLVCGKSTMYLLCFVDFSFEDLCCYLFFCLGSRAMSEVVATAVATTLARGVAKGDRKSGG